MSRADSGAAERNPRVRHLPQPTDQVARLAPHRACVLARVTIQTKCAKSVYACHCGSVVQSQPMSLWLRPSAQVIRLP